MIVPRVNIGAIRGGVPYKITKTVQQCAIYVDVRTTPVQNPLDIRDLAIASDGSFLTLDGGDSDHDRAKIAIEKLPAGGGTASIYRFAYPGGAKLDANAFLIGPGDIPIIFATEPDGRTGIYTVAALPAAVN